MVATDRIVLGAIPIAIRNGKGSADALYLEDNMPDPVPSGDQILVCIRAFGLNRLDTMQREDRDPYTSLDKGSILGVEFSTERFSVEDAVLGLVPGGAVWTILQHMFLMTLTGLLRIKYAEKVAVSEKILMPKPPSVSFEAAAGIPEAGGHTYLTAFQALSLVGGIETGQKVLVHLGSSGIGQAAIQTAKLLGASKVYVTANSTEKCQRCVSLGADMAINDRDPTKDFAAVIHEDTNGYGVDLIIDLVGQRYWHQNVTAAALDAKIVIVAMMSGGEVERFDLRAFLKKRMQLLCTTLRLRDLEYKAQLRDQFVEKVLPYFESGDVKVLVDQVLSWNQVDEGHRRMESNVSAGKIICVVD
ncbi:hypothetical protein N7510_001684 [Penicillium lagena]|uniref:uncharacterized protein n=1 Tax=Penicillium lagena TaxID=94218 RepID=UPI00254224D3|nr:uncharacterized protein N7510_001684 [Penicillium lagena]KAJ5625375.1 hypothetical protein N7510_001684 [Penicillium lagena]